MWFLIEHLSWKILQKGYVDVLFSIPINPKGKCPFPSARLAFLYHLPVWSTWIFAFGHYVFGPNMLAVKYNIENINININLPRDLTAVNVTKIMSTCFISKPNIFDFACFYCFMQVKVICYKKSNHSFVKKQ